MLVSGIVGIPHDEGPGALDPHREEGEGPKTIFRTILSLPFGVCFHDVETQSRLQKNNHDYTTSMLVVRLMCTVRKEFVYRFDIQSPDVVDVRNHLFRLFVAWKKWEEKEILRSTSHMNHLKT